MCRSPSRTVIVAIAASLASLFVVGGLSSGAEKENAKSIPLLGDETPLIRVKTNPERYVGKAFVISGGINIDDYYNFFYLHAGDSHVSLRFSEFSKVDLNEETATVNERAHLYLSKKRGASVIDGQRTWEEGHKRGKHVNVRLSRVRVTLLPEAWAEHQQWSHLEVLDVQFYIHEKNAWGPWVIEEQVKQEEAER